MADISPIIINVDISCFEMILQDFDFAFQIFHFFAATTANVSSGVAPNLFSAVFLLFEELSKTAKN